MIIEALMRVVFVLFEALFSGVNIASISESDLSYFHQYLDLVVDFGTSLVNLFIPFDFCQFLIGIVIAIELVIDIYQVVMWVYRKIPMVNGS